jgi:hypothetical protein
MKAFPNMTGEKGMDLRDYFAAKAMQALIQASTSLNAKNDNNFLEEFSFENAVSCGVNSQIELTGENPDGTDFTYTWARHYVEEAYSIANEMMEERVRRDMPNV